MGTFLARLLRRVADNAWTTTLSSHFFSQKWRQLPSGTACGNSFRKQLTTACAIDTCLGLATLLRRPSTLGGMRMCAVSWWSPSRVAHASRTDVVTRGRAVRAAVVVRGGLR